MQFSVYDVINKVNIIQEIIDTIELDEPISEHVDDIKDLLQEYSDILKLAKVHI